MMRIPSGGAARQIVAALLVFCPLCVANCLVPAAGERAPAAGAFKDSAGGSHAWTIAASHALIWDDKPYIPFGVVFAPRSTEDDTPEAWTEDTQALAALKARHILDVVIQPATPLPAVPPARTQRLLDYLDAGGFRYGLAFGPGLNSPLSGTIVRPSVYRYASSGDALSATWKLADASGGFFALADSSNDGQVVRTGEATSHDGTVTVPLEPVAGAGKLVALLFPHKQIPVGRAGLADLWTGFDAYRDRVLGCLAALHPGRGLRFLLDPLGAQVSLDGERDFLVPDSPEFAIEWESWLRKRFATVDEQKQAWGLTDDNLTTVQDMAHLLPLWANASGAPYLYNATGRKLYKVTDTRQSSWWQDFLTCRNQSIQYFMNTLSRQIRGVTDVPVVYTYTGAGSLFINTDPSGFDGIAAPASGYRQLSQTLCPAYSAAEQSARTVWCIATEVTQDAGKDPSAGIRAARQAGMKGFIAGTAGPGASSMPGATDIAAQAGALESIAREADAVNPTAMASDHPRVLFYPLRSPGPAHSGPIPSQPDLLWLGTLLPGETQDWWPAYSGYSLRPADAAGMETVLVSLEGRRETHISLSGPPDKAADARLVRAERADGTPAPIKITGPASFVVTLDESPTVFRTPGYRLVPAEAAQEVVAQLLAMHEIAQHEKLSIAQLESAPVDRASEELSRRNYDQAYTLARGALDELTALMQPYVWVEGESTRIQTFGEVAQHAEASSGAYLRLDTEDAPGKLGYAARYYVDAPADGQYNIWLAGTLPGPETSPIHWKVNAEPEAAPSGVTPHQNTYVNGRFGWTLLGSAHLAKGRQAVGIFVTDRAAASSRYVFAIDALLLTTRSFSPNATYRPLPVEMSGAPRRRK